MLLSMKKMRLKLLCCEILTREAEAAAAGSNHQVEIEFLPKKLHDRGQALMLPELQRALSAQAGKNYDYLLLGYGLCNNGVVGLTAADIPLVIPRAHDCITLFLGSRARYTEYFHQNPGVYFLTSGWIDYGQNEQDQLSVQHRLGLDKSYTDLVREYGADNAAYIQETLGGLTSNYQQFTYIDMGVEPDDRYEQIARQRAADKNWRFQKIPGDLTLMRKLLGGDWPEEEFLTVPPGKKIVQTYDDRIIASE